MWPWDYNIKIHFSSTENYGLPWQPHKNLAHGFVPPARI